MTRTNCILSRNSKTGYSINTWTCQPTAQCRLWCYRFKRTKEQALAIERRCGFNPGSNTGPITWKIQTEAYKRNEETIKQAAAEGRLEELAVRLVQQMDGKEEDLRWCGTGDLFPELCELIAMYAAMGRRHSFGFSRRPEMLCYLASLLDDMGVHGMRRPYFLGSVDSSTTDAELENLMMSTNLLNEKLTFHLAGARLPRAALAYATWKTGLDVNDELVRIDPPAVRVVFGIHSSQKKTKTDHRLACPATEGGKIKCVECRRCYGEGL